MKDDAEKRDGESRNVQKELHSLLQEFDFGFFPNVQGESRTLTIFKIICL